MSVAPSVLVHKMIKCCLFVLYIARTECLYGISQEPTVLSSVSLVSSVFISVILKLRVFPWYIAKTECSVQFVATPGGFV